MDNTKRFSLGSSCIGDLEKQYVLDVLNKNYISPGPVVEEVEKLCAELHGKCHAISVNSGQSAIHVALQAIKELYIPATIKPVVAVPACTYISTLAAAVLSGCDIVLVDVQVHTGNMSPTDLLRVIKEQEEIGEPVDIVVPVHLYGYACSQEIFDICQDQGIWIVEDACESTFTPNIGRGHVLTTSFYTNHLISGGCGGMIMTNNDELDHHCWKLINHGRIERINNDDIYKISEKFRFDVWGHSMKWNDVSAALVKAQIERREELYDKRRRNAIILTSYLESLLSSLYLPPTENHTYMMYPIVLPGETNRGKRMRTDRVIKELNDHNVEVRRMMPITNQPVVQNYFKHLNLDEEFPGASIINERGFYVGCHPEFTVDDMHNLGEIVRKAIERHL